MWVDTRNEELFESDETILIIIDVGEQSIKLVLTDLCEAHGPKAGEKLLLRAHTIRRLIDLIVDFAVMVSLTQ